jgi:hypothetical protein
MTSAPARQPTSGYCTVQRRFSHNGTTNSQNPAAGRYNQRPTCHAFPGKSSPSPSADGNNDAIAAITPRPPAAIAIRCGPENFISPPHSQNAKAATNAENATQLDGGR